MTSQDSPAADYRISLLVQADQRQAVGDHTMDRLSANLLGLGGQEPSMTKKPRVTAQTDGTFLVTFGHGGRAEIIEHVDGGWDVSEYHGGRCGRGQCHSTEAAVESAAILTFVPDVFAPWGTEADLQALALACNHDRAMFVKTIKRIAKERFGVKLSVRGGTGTAYGWVHVKPLKAGDLGAQVITSTMCKHGLIRPCGGERVAIICALAGHPLPEGFKVRAPQWD